MIINDKQEMTSKLHRGKLDRVQFDRLKFDRGKRVRGKFDRDTFEKGKFDVKISLLKTLDGGKLIEADTNGWGGPNNHLKTGPSPQAGNTGPP